MDGLVLRDFEWEGGGREEGGRGGREEKGGDLVDFLEFGGEVGERGEEGTVVREKEGFLGVFMTEGGEPMVGQEERGGTNKRGVVDALVGGGGGGGRRGGGRGRGGGGGRGGGELEVEEAVSFTEEEDFRRRTGKDLVGGEREREGGERDSWFKGRGKRGVVSLGVGDKEEGGKEGRGGGGGGRRRRRRRRRGGRGRRGRAVRNVRREDGKAKGGCSGPYFSIFWETKGDFSFLIEGHYGVGRRRGGRKRRKGRGRRERRRKSRKMNKKKILNFSSHFKKFF